MSVRTLVNAEMEGERLNEAQRRAVEHSADEPLLVLAAAGTGKTETLTMRIAHFVKVRGVPHHGILAVTFSNRAAREMRERAAAACGLPVNAMTVGTFHSICMRVLRSHGKRGEFTVLDRKDALHMVTDLLPPAKDGMQPPKAADVYAVLNKWRNDCLEPDDVPPHDHDGMDAEAVAYRVYRKFRAECEEQCCMDFADILCNAVRVMTEDAGFLAGLRERWTHVLVDEFQDTNGAQHRFVKLVVGSRGRITAVGDDCQTIHEHAGARVERILDFANDFPGTSEIALEMNYRSTGFILDAANNVIAKNEKRMDKRLICTKEQGEPVVVYETTDEVAEAQLIVSQIRTTVKRGMAYGDVCVLYRINACSQMIEAALRRAKIPFRVAGALSFFERAEVRVAMAYLVVAVNPRSMQHVQRAMRMPSRGVGKATLDRLAALADETGTDVVTVATSHPVRFNGKTLAGLKRFVEAVTVERGRAYEDAQSLAAAANGVVRRSGLVEHFRSKKDHEAAENVEAFMAVVVRTSQAMVLEDDGLTLAGLVRRISNEESSAMTTTSTEQEDQVTLMSIHRSKGLEWEHVHVAGFADGLMPYKMSVQEGNMEGERRLAYVAVTRARTSLTCSWPRTRTAPWGERQTMRESPFVSDMGEDVIRAE